VRSAAARLRGATATARGASPRGGAPGTATVPLNADPENSQNAAI
jgi:hypothetical protein